MNRVDPGHTVIAVPVPALDEFVRARTAHYDADYLAPDPAFGQAHVTLLAPWLREPGEDDLALVGEIVHGAEPFDYLLDGVETFPDGTIHLRAQPDEGFRSLTRALVRAFPKHPPYGGRFPGEPVPHVTLDAESGGVDAARVRALLPLGLPVVERAAQVQLQWWAPGRCRVLRRWTLGGI